MRRRIDTGSPSSAVMIRVARRAKREGYSFRAAGWLCAWGN
jgi:hypothetical protein